MTYTISTHTATNIGQLFLYQFEVRLQITYFIFFCTWNFSFFCFTLIFLRMTYINLCFYLFV